jgi:hypothetical protein
VRAVEDNGRPAARKLHPPGNGDAFAPLDAAPKGGISPLPEGLQCERRAPALCA